MRIVTIIGARPQFIKAAPVSRVLRDYAQEILVHTGQHYDNNMSKVFFDELNLPLPDVNLGVGSGTHGGQTAQMLEKIEKLLLDILPDWVLVYGDTNSTLAGALAATKLHIPVAHVEAGLRSFNKRMPEEVNRVLTDHISCILFCPTRAAVDNLKIEGISSGVYNVGDVMYDALLYNLSLAQDNSNILVTLGLNPKNYALSTVHRASNTDDFKVLRNIFDGLGTLETKVVLPLHPRTKKTLNTYNIKLSPNVIVIDPVGYLDMLQLERNADCILTDSGGVQKEAYLLGVRCITLRNETEWVETVESGWNKLVGAEKEAIQSLHKDWYPKEHRPNIFGDGTAANRIAKYLMSLD